jgi:hypothetical protein
MKKYIDEFIAIEREISEEKGSFELFALFLREDTIGKWDLLVAAPWLFKNKAKGLDYIVKKIQKKFKENEDPLIMLSRIVIIEKNNPALEDFLNTFNVEHNRSEVVDSNLFGLQIKHGYVITAKKVKYEEDKVK